MTASALRTLFESFGTVRSAQLLARAHGRYDGFVEMSTSKETQAAVKALQNKEMNGCLLTVRETEPTQLTVIV